MARLSLRSGFAWTLLSQVVYAGCLWAQLALLTKLGSPSAVGRFALASAVSAPPVVLAHMQLRAVLASDAAGQFDFRDYLGVRLVLLIPAVAFVFLVGWLGYSWEQTIAIMLFGIGRAVESVSDIFHGYAQKHDRLDLIARSLMLKGLAALAAFAAVFNLTGSVSWALAANALAWLVPLLAFDIPRCRALPRPPGSSLRPRWRWPAARALIALALPMGLVMLAIQMRVTISRTLLEVHRSEAELGIFTALAYLAVAGTAIMASLGQSVLARFGRYVAEDRADLMTGLLIRMLGLALLAGVGGVAVALSSGGPLLRWLYAPEYASHADLLVLVMADGALVYLSNLLSAAATAMRLFVAQLVIHAVGLMLLTGCGLRLIPTHGMQGAAWAMVAASVWVTVALAWLVFRRLQGLRRQPHAGGATSLK